MPDIQCIPDVADREFPAGVGHWAGDCVWDAGPVLGKQNIAKLSFPDGSFVRTMSLSYPHVEPKPNESVFFGFNFTSLVSAIYGKLKITITDGVYEYIQDHFPLPYYLNWAQLSGPNFLVPSDWIVPNTLIQVRAETTTHVAVDMYFDDFSLIYTTTPAAKIQYLPLMGIG